jgi:hypothetical protein
MGKISVERARERYGVEIDTNAQVVNESRTRDYRIDK